MLSRLRHYVGGGFARKYGFSMKITILHIGEVPAPLRDEFGPYMPMFHRLFAAVDTNIEFETIAIADGADFPDMSKLEALLIPGSAVSVYDDLAWMEPLRAYIRSAYAARKPMIGVCFGHQVMADALGGTVEKSDRGWGLGRHTYDVDNNSLAAAYFGQTAAIAASHQDQVVAPPPNAKIFMSSDFTPTAGLVYENGAALSMQPHPEFDTAYAKALCDLRLSETCDQTWVDTAKSTLDAPMDNKIAAQFFVNFLRSVR